MTRLFRSALAASVLLLAGAAGRTLSAQGMRYGVYVELADSLHGSLDEITATLRPALAAGDWQVVAVHDVGVDRQACGYAARVLVLHNERYARDVLAHGPRAAFALPMRLFLFQDEDGTHLAAVNGYSINRTIIAESGFEGPTDAAMQDITRLAAGVLQGSFVPRQYGQLRTRGYIGRTMGIMAGGPFAEKIELVRSAAGSSPQDVRRVAAQLADGLRRQAGRGRWQLRPIYQIDLAAQGVVVLGVSGAALESRAIAIVGAGGNESRSAFRCPGLDHAGAFPIEVVVWADSGQVRVGVVDEMYRMKLFFEDAGKMRFAQNMRMPGSVEGELKDLLRPEAESRP